VRGRRVVQPWLVGRPGGFNGFGLVGLVGLAVDEEVAAGDEEGDGPVHQAQGSCAGHRSQERQPSALLAAASHGLGRGG